MIYTKGEILYMYDEKALRLRLKNAKVKLLWLSSVLKKPYSTLSSWINGYTPLPEAYRQKIVKIVEIEESLNLSHKEQIYENSN